MAQAGKPGSSKWHTTLSFVFILFLAIVKIEAVDELATSTPATNDYSPSTVEPVASSSYETTPAAYDESGTKPTEDPYIHLSEGKDPFEVIDVAEHANDDSKKVNTGETTKIYTTGDVNEDFWLKHLGDDFKNAIHLQVGGNEQYEKLYNMSKSGYPLVTHEYVRAPPPNYYQGYNPAHHFLPPLPPLYGRPKPIGREPYLPEMDSPNNKYPQSYQPNQVMKNPSSSIPQLPPPSQQEEIPQPNYPVGPSNYPEPKTSYPETQPNYPKSQPSYPESQPSYPESQSTYPESEPSYPKNQPSFSKTQPSYPDSEPSYTESRPNYSETKKEYSEPEPEPALPESRPNYSESQKKYSEPEPSHPESEPNYPESQPSTPTEDPSNNNYDKPYNASSSGPETYPEPPQQPEPPKLPKPQDDGGYEAEFRLDEEGIRKIARKFYNPKVFEIPDSLPSKHKYSLPKKYSTLKAKEKKYFQKLHTKALKTSADLAPVVVNLPETQTKIVDSIDKDEEPVVVKMPPVIYHSHPTYVQDEKDNYAGPGVVPQSQYPEQNSQYSSYPQQPDYSNPYFTQSQAPYGPAQDSLTSPLTNPSSPEQYPSQHSSYPTQNYSPHQQYTSHQTQYTQPSLPQHSHQHQHYHHSHSHSHTYNHPNAPLSEASSQTPTQQYQTHIPQSQEILLQPPQSSPYTAEQLAKSFSQYKASSFYNPPPFEEPTYSNPNIYSPNSPAIPTDTSSAAAGPSYYVNKNPLTSTDAVGTPGSLTSTTSLSSSPTSLHSSSSLYGSSYPSHLSYKSNYNGYARATRASRDLFYSGL